MLKIILMEHLRDGVNFKKEKIIEVYEDDIIPNVGDIIDLGDELFEVTSRIFSRENVDTVILIGNLSYN